MYQKQSKTINIGREKGERNASKCELIDKAIKEGRKTYLTSAEKRMYEQWKKTNTSLDVVV